MSIRVMIANDQRMWALSPRLARSLAAALGLALLWWGVAWWARTSGALPVPIWYDQEHIFLRAAQAVADPYQVYAFVNPPWTAVALWPFSLLPLPLASLAQTCLYFGALAGVVVRFGGDWRRTVIALTSFVAFDSVLELNVDWLVCLGLLVPVAWSGPLLLVKPQAALGYYFGFRPRDWLRVALVAAPVLLASFAVWGWWPPKMLGGPMLTTASYNVAPAALLTAPVSLAVGAALAWRSFRRQDPALGVAAGLFFVPYLAFYSLLAPFALLAARYPRVALLASGLMWVIYGSFFVRFFLGGQAR